MGALGYEAETTGGRRPPRRTAVLAALLAVSSIAPIAVAVSAAPAGAATGKVAVRAIGTAPYVPNGARVLGAVPATTRIRFDVVLRPRDPASLQAFVNAVSTPGSPEYRHYLAPGRFGHVFGPQPGTITALRAWLRSTGLDPGPTTVDGLTVPVVATAASIEGALGLHLNRYKLASGRTAFANTTAPHLPAALAGALATVLGLDNLHLSHSLGVQNASRNAAHGTPAGAAPTGQRQTISPRAVASPCTAAATAASNSGSYTANQVAKASITSVAFAANTALHAAKGAGAVLAPAVGAAKAAANAARVIAKFAIEFRETVMVNKVLKNPELLDLRAFKTCPLLGAYMLVCSDTSDLVAMLFDEFGQAGWMEDIESLLKKHIHPVQDRAADLVQSSPFVISGVPIHRPLRSTLSVGSMLSNFL